MKKLLLILGIAALGWNVEAQVAATSDQYTILAKRSADWCPFCGMYAWDMLANVIDRLDGERIIPFAYHYAGGLKNDASTAISDNLGGSSQPIFFLNNDNIGVSSSNVNAKVDEVFETAGFLNEFQAFAGVGLDTYLNANGDELTVYANVKFFAQLDGEYYLGLYLIQDNLIHNQSGRGNDVAHKNVVTHSFFEDAGGMLIVNGPVSAADDFNYEATLPVTSDMVDVSDMSVMAIIWNKTPNGNFVFNANLDAEIGIASSSDDIALDQIEMKAYQNGDQLNIQIASDTHIENASIQVVSINGQILFNEALTLNTQYHNLVNVASWADGTYIVQLLSKEGTKSTKVNIIH